MKSRQIIAGALLWTTIFGFSSSAFAVNTFTATPNPVPPGQTISFTGSVDPGVTANDVKVDLWIHNSAGTQTGVAAKLHINFVAGHPQTLTLTYAVPSTTPVGTYTYNLNFYNSADGSALAGAANKANDGSYIVGTSTGGGGGGGTTSSLNKVCASAVVVGLKWPAVTGATHYTLSRSGTVITPSGGITYTNWADQGVKASTAYTYTLASLNASNSTVSSTNLAVTTAAATGTGDPAYCQSSVITGMTPNWSKGIAQLNGSDIWAQTVGNDGYEYGYFGDGAGFGGTSTSTNGAVSWGIGKIVSSTPGTISDAVNVYGGLNGQHPASISGKTGSIIAAGANFYAIGGLSSSTSSQTKGPVHTQGIIYSNGNAWSWKDNSPNWTFCAEATWTANPNLFCPGNFVQNGKGYSGNTDGFLYITGGTNNDYYGDGTPGQAHTYLWRVKPASILDKNAYQAFKGLDEDGDPTWATGSFATLSAAMKPIFVDHGPRGLSIARMAYNPVLKRYIASAEGAVNQAAFYDAPNPWGPWTSIGYFNSNPSNNSGGWGELGTGISWGTNHGSGLGISFADKWLSADGKTMWVVFSSDGNAGPKASLTAVQNKDMDGFLAVPVVLTTSR